MKKFLVWTIVIFSLVAILLRFGDKISEIFLGAKQESGISILSQPSEAEVFLDDKQVGQTPFEDKDLKVKDYVVRLEKGELSWQGKVKLTAGTVTVINRDIASDSASSAGEMLTLNKGKGLTVISNPTGSEIQIDGKLYGATPVSVNTDPGEHTILLSHPNYLNRSIRVDLPKNFNLTISVDLALSEADLTTIATPAITQTPEVIVKETPTGFLRVRDKPNTAGKEIARVKPGDSLILLEETGSWDKVRLPDGTEGFVAASYVEKSK